MRSSLIPYVAILVATLLAPVALLHAALFGDEGGR